MAFSQKYTIVAPFRELELGTEFTPNTWPLHVTIADTFAVDISHGDVIKKLEAMVAQDAAFEVIGEKDAHFGDKGEVHVVLLAINNALLSLHSKVIDILDSAGAVYNDPHYTREGFVPHVTVRSHAPMVLGTRINICQLALIDMFPDGDHKRRKVLAIIKYPA